MKKNKKSIPEILRTVASRDRDRILRILREAGASIPDNVTVWDQSSEDYCESHILTIQVDKDSPELELSVTMQAETVNGEFFYTVITHFMIGDARIRLHRDVCVDQWSSGVETSWYIDFINIDNYTTVARLAEHLQSFFSIDVRAPVGERENRFISDQQASQALTGMAKCCVERAAQS